MNKLERWYLHVDLDAFFASVEQLDHPEYRGKPVIVGGKPDDRRSVVSTASYEARKYGVHSAMPTYQAYKLCPNGIYVHGRMDRYSDLSFQIMNIFRNYSPTVDQMSIDEAFIDITGTQRLFGPPLELAKKIKAEVKSKTGLTVSIGIAPTKYLAKIASGFQKPDGITFINQGEEEKFMLDLPLNKVWGLGPKSLELIYSKGIRTTRDIHEMPIENLKFLFGNNMGTYLYEVVRGNEKATFSRESKNHSISSESTYPYDLIDLYTIETELLELAHGVFFRLLKENGYSRTAFVKIRYDDFTTVSVQETLDRNIITLDSYFEILKKLFEKKYERGRGIRLLGVGFENIENEEKPHQQDLFDNSDEKKQAVEKAILKLEKKHPEIKIRKARTFKSIILILLVLLNINKIEAQSNSNEAINSGAATLLPDTLYVPSDNINTKTQSSAEQNNGLFEYEIEGYYQAELQTGLSSNFGKNINTSFSFIDPIFLQEVDISAYVTYNKNWYFQTEFADKFNKNTIAIGYKSDFLNAKISNRNIGFPDGYSAEFFGYSPKSGQNQTPGFSLNLKSPVNKWNADFLFRYDMTDTHTATFYGKNKVTEIYISPADYVYGRYFIFPENSSEHLQDIKNIYIEDKNGTYKDSNGKLYKQLSITDYAIRPDKNSLLISSNAGGNKKNGIIPSILITFNSIQTTNRIITSTGNYNDSNSYASSIQAKIGSEYDLTKYSYDLYTEIDNTPALVVQNSSGFSPYLNKNLYDCGLIQNGELLVISKTSGNILKRYKVSPWDDYYTTLFEDFFNEKHYYSQITDTLSNESEYPLGEVAPEIYLNLECANDISLLVRNYSPVKELSIGANASAGSVQVYRNGTLETGALYNAESGTITLPTPVSNTDKIYIIWQEDTKDYSKGVLTGAAGYKINFNDFLSGDISFTTQWPISAFRKEEIFSTIDDYKNGYSAITAGIKYKTDFFTLSDKTNITLSKENAANKLLVCSQENILPSTYYLNSTSGYSTKVEPCLNISGTNKQLLSQDNCTINNHNGIQDSSISGYAIPVYWDFSKSANPWASVDILLSEGKLLKSSSLFELALKLNIPSEEFNNYEFYLQLGIEASDTFSGENTQTIPTWKLDLSNSNNWQQIRITLNDQQRAKLVSYHDARIIVKSTRDKLDSFEGSLFIGPYEPYTQSIYTKAPEEIILSTSTFSYNSDYYSSNINWHIPENTDIISLSDPYIYTYKHFTSADYSNYGFINLDFAINEVSNFTLLLKNNESTSIQLELLETSIYNNSSINYHTLKIDINTKDVYIDDNKLPGDKYRLIINSSVIPSTQTIIIPLSNNGSFYLGNMYYEDTSIIVSARNYAEAIFEKDFNHINIKASANSLQSTGSFTAPDVTIISNGKTSLTTTYASLQADLSLTNETLTNAGHILKSEKPLLNAISLSEEYRYSNTEKSLSKSNQFIINTEPYNVPLRVSFTSTADDSLTAQNQKLQLDSIFDYKLNNYETGLSVGINYNQKNNPLVISDISCSKDNYFISWKDITSLEFSMGDENAYERQENYSIKLFGAIPFNDFKPALTYNLYGQYRNTTELEFFDKEQLQLSLPFTILSNNLTLNISRISSGVSNFFDGTNYFSDTNTLFKTQNKRGYFYTSIPIYELFSQNLKDEISDNYSAKYEAIYKRKLYNSMKDLFIPSSASFSVIRDIKAQNNIKDLYQYKTVITSTSINNFGSDSINSIFNWFKQEEIISSITGIFKVPADKPETTTFQITGYIQTVFMINDLSSLTTALDGSIETNNDWSTHVTAIYSRPSEISLIKSLFCFIIPKLNSVNFDITRKNIVNIQISNINNINKQLYSIQHNVEHKFLQHYSVSTGIGGTFSYIEKQSNKLDINVKLGFKAEF